MQLVQTILGMCLVFNVNEKPEHVSVIACFSKVVVSPMVCVIILWGSRSYLPSTVSLKHCC